MMKKMGLALLSLGLMLSVVGTSIYAYTEVSVENSFTTGIVDVELDEYTIENGKEVKWENPKWYLLPGEDVSKIPRIENHGNDCYVRADIRFLNAWIDEKSIYGMSDDWIMAADGFYYYKDILASGDSVDLFQGFHVPTDLNEEAQESQLLIEIDVEAVQSDHFTPDFEVYDPWANIEIQECKKEGMYDISTFKSMDCLDFEISYVEQAGKLLTNHEDFFANFPVLLPGDVYMDTVHFENQSQDTINLYFRSFAPKGTDLLDKVMLKITKNFNGIETIIYDGSVRASDLQENLLLATVPKAGTGVLAYEIYVPETLDNAYTLMNDSVVWIFSTVPIENIDSVPTGDETYLSWIWMIFIGSVCIFVGIGTLMYEKVVKRRGNKKTSN